MFLYPFQFARLVVCALRGINLENIYNNYAGNICNKYSVRGKSFETSIAPVAVYCSKLVHTDYTIKLQHVRMLYTKKCIWTVTIYFMHMIYMWHCSFKNGHLHVHCNIIHLRLKYARQSNIYLKKSIAVHNIMPYTSIFQTQKRRCCKCYYGDFIK